MSNQLRRLLPKGSRVSLLAIDGAVTAEVVGQLSRVSSDATLLVVSAGGNDALGEAHLLTRPARSVGEAVAQLAGAQRSFAYRYGVMVQHVAAVGLPTAFCTIYDANFPPPEGELVTAALSLFNDAITRTAFSRGSPLIDLRLICDDPGDYANPIEPSVQGGAKIASAIAAWATNREARRRSVVIAAP